MKQKHFLWLIVILFLTSCTQDEITYSCNPEINEWTKSHLSEITQMSRNSWLKQRDHGYKMAIYAAFTPQQKFTFWKEKIAEVIELDWNSDEKKHILSLNSYIEEHRELFNTKTFDEDSFDRYMYLWFETAKEKFKWSNETLFAMVVSGEIMTDKTGTLKIREANPFTRNRTKVNSECDCNQSDDWCQSRVNNLPPNYPTIIADCSQESCELKSGCGVLFLKECNGICKYQYI